MTTPRRTLTGADLARELGVGRMAPTRWRRAGCPHSRTKKGPRFNAEEVRSWLASRGRRSPGQRGRTSELDLLHAAAAAGELPPRARDAYDKLAVSKAKQAHWRAELSRLVALRLSGELLDRGEVERAQLAAIRATVAAMDAAPARWRRKLVGLDERQAVAVLERIMAELARTYCGDLTPAHLCAPCLEKIGDAEPAATNLSTCQTKT